MSTPVVTRTVLVMKRNAMGHYKPVSVASDRKCEVRRGGQLVTRVGNKRLRVLSPVMDGYPYRVALD